MQICIGLKGQLVVSFSSSWEEEVITDNRRAEENDKTNAHKFKKVSECNYQSRPEL